MGAGPSSRTAGTSDDADESKAGKSLSAKFVTKYSVESTKGKKDIKIHHVTTLPDDRVCVIDASNCFFQLLSEDYVVYDEVHLFGCCSCTCIDDNTIAIAIMIPEKSYIVWYSVKDNKITEIKKKADIDGMINDLAYRDGEYIVRYEKEGIDYTSKGNKCITKRKTGAFSEGSTLYDSISDSVIQSSYCDKAVTCCTPNGKVKWRVTVDGLPGGLVVINDVILVCDLHRNVVRQIAMDGRQLATPLLSEEDGIKEPYSIAYQKHKQRLLVGQHCDNTFMIFGLSDSQ